VIHAIILVGLIAIGYLIIKSGLFRREDVGVLTRLVFYVTLPATVIGALTSVSISYDWIYLPLSSLLVGMACYGLSYLCYRRFGMGKRRGGAFIIGSSSMNMGFFMYPFFSSYLGNEGLARIAFFDLGQVFLLYGVGYYVAATYGENRGGVVKKVLSFPPLYALLIGLGLNLTGTSLGIFEDLVSTLGSATIPLAMIVMGMSMELPAGSRSFSQIASALGIRFVFSFLAAGACVFLFGLQELEALTVMIGSCAPPAIMTLIFSIEEGLDTAFTAFLLTIGTLVGIGLTTALFMLLA